MIVVSDTSPLNYLILIDLAEVLPVFGRVYAPSAVIRELSHAKAPDAVRAWAASPPGWLGVRDPKVLIEPMKKLGPGETAAISLALELKADRVLIDERDGTKEAARRGLVTTSVLSIVEFAAGRQLIDVERTIEALRATSYRASEAHYRGVLDRVREQERTAEEESMKRESHRQEREARQKDEPEIER